MREFWKEQAAYLHDKLEKLKADFEELSEKYEIQQQRLDYHIDLVAAQTKYIDKLLKEQAAYQELKARVGKVRPMGIQKIKTFRSK